MKKFNYKFQKILDIKTKLEKQAKYDFALINERYLIEQGKLQELHLRRDKYEMELKDLMIGVINPKKIMHARSDISFIDSLIARQMIVVNQIEEELETARQTLIELMQERKIHEKLKEKEFTKYEMECKTEEEKDVQDYIGYSYYKKLHSND